MDISLHALYNGQTLEVHVGWRADYSLHSPEGVSSVSQITTVKFHQPKMRGWRRFSGLLDVLLQNSLLQKTHPSRCMTVSNGGVTGHFRLPRPLSHPDQTFPVNAVILRELTQHAYQAFGSAGHVP